jgi:hypothetical protein
MMLKLRPFIGIAVFALVFIFLMVILVKAIKLLFLLALSAIAVLIVGGVFLAARKFTT